MNDIQMKAFLLTAAARMSSIPDRQGTFYLLTRISSIDDGKGLYHWGSSFGLWRRQSYSFPMQGSSILILLRISSDSIPSFNQLIQSSTSCAGLSVCISKYPDFNVPPS